MNSEGRFDPCCSPDELRQTLGYFGNVGDEGLLNIWQSLEYQNLIENYLDFDVCKQCNMRQLPGEKLSVLPRPSPCGKFHISNDGERTHNSEFDWVLPFHNPGLAPVGDKHGSYHIYLDGNPAYSARYKRTFGFIAISQQ